MSSAITPHSAANQTAVGFTAAFSAFLIWGVTPIYFKAVGMASPVEILAHRIVWTVVLMAGLVTAIGKGRMALAELARPSRLAVYALSTVLVSINWLVYIYAISIDRLLEASLGYFINPLVNVLLGMVFLSERLNRWQSVAVALACAGVGYQVVGYGAVPWISLALAFSFGFYALVRKKARIDPFVGLLTETLLLCPLAIAYLVMLGAAGTGQFLTGRPVVDLLLVASGLVTGVPLILFMLGAQRLTLSTIGLMQYLAPTLQFLLAVLLFREPFGAPDLVTFAAIWVGLAIYSWDAVSTYRGARRRVATSQSAS